MPKINKPKTDEIELKELLTRLESIEKLIHENNLLVRILAQPILFESLHTIFNSPKQLRAYELSDGERSTRDIGKLLNLDQKGISNWWREWEKEGIVKKVGKKGQYKARYTLLELLIVYLPSRQLKPSKKENQDGSR